MIKNREPLTMVEVVELTKNSKKDNTELIGFIKRFDNFSVKEVREIKEKMNKLNNLKLNEEHIVKIIDLQPETALDFNKIFADSGVSLDEDETKKILEIIKEYR